VALFNTIDGYIVRFRAWTLRFWARVSDGMAVHELWSQFRAEATSGYRLYSRDVEAGGQQKTKLEVVRAFFWAILMKLGPARRVILLVALGLILFPTMRVVNADKTIETTNFTFWGALLLLLLLILEIADRVTMKRDLQIAREIQLWLVPTEVPELPGLDVAWMNRPQNTVAGDYYDVFSRDTGRGERVLMVVADVAGKSIPAALLMATFQASLKTLCATPCSLMELAVGLNRYSCAHSKGGQRFTTAFLAEFDPVTRELEYINAGHNPPFLRGASGSTAGSIAKLEEGGLPFGIPAGMTYNAGHRTLAPGDTLLIYTDGLVEAVNSRDEEFGEDRTIAWLLTERTSVAAKDALARLTAQLNAYVGMTVQHDDITCLLVQIPQ
jgi:sigma-B regulation protein RsbU (phosphoserine phosphatase)